MLDTIKCQFNKVQAYAVKNESAYLKKEVKMSSIVIVYSSNTAPYTKVRFFKGCVTLWWLTDLHVILCL